jgi:hypothetical protein
MSVAPAAVQPSPAEFGGWDHYSFDVVMSMSAETDNSQQTLTENQRLSPLVFVASYRHLSID